MAQIKGTSEEKIKGIIRRSFCQFYVQKLNQPVDLHFEFGEKLSIYRLYQIVEKVNNPEKEIAVSDSRIREGKSENNTFFLPLEVANSSFNLVSEIKEMIQQGLKEIDWESQSKLLQKIQQEESFVRGNLSGKRGEYYLVNLVLGGENITGFWEKKEWTSTRQQPHLGQSLLFLIKQVNEKLEKDKPSFLLTRSSDTFFLKVLKHEVPEIKEGIVVVQQILRVPGSIKIAVESKKRGVDPVGACIGLKGIRIRSVSESLLPERIDIVSWVKERKNLEGIRKPLEEIGSYKNIQLRTSEETSEQKDRPWTKKISNKI